MFTLRPFLENFVRIGILVDIFGTLILLSGIYAASSSKHILYLALFIAFPTVLTNWASNFMESPSLLLASDIFSGIFFVFMAAVILNYLFREEQITVDVIAGAICAYFLIGLVWSSVFSILELLQPGSFDISQSLHTESDPFTYYSYVTLTTLGYGDITPITAQARSFSLLEAIIGQLYLATLLARLVSINIFQSIEKKSQ
jgi:hypothetical protein